MKLFYIANIRFPTERAHGIQVGKMCEAFARRHGTNTEPRQRGTEAEQVEVTLLVPLRKTIREDPYGYYGLQPNFKIEQIPVLDIVSWGRIGFLIESMLFAYKAALRTRKEKNAIVYSREELPFWFLPRNSAFYEAHQLRRSFFFRLLFKQAKGVVSISQGLKEVLVKRMGYPEDKILVAHDAVDDKAFSVQADKKEVRRHLGLPEEGKIVMYIGGFEEWKGLQILCEAAPAFQNEKVLVAVIGGTAGEQETIQKRYPSVRFLGSRPYAELPSNQQAADVLVIPNSAKTELGSEFTSPLKLFAHMSSGVPLVVADVPALREVVGPREALLFTPDDPEDLTRAVFEALKPEATTRVTHAAEKAKVYTWIIRARNILTFCRM